MGTRLFTMVNSDGGEWLLPDADGREIDLYEAVTNGWLVVFTLPEGTYPALIPHVCRYALAALNAVATRLEREGRRARSLVFVDELSAFDGDQLCGGLERGRSAGMSYIVASQSVSNFRTAGGEKLLDAVLDNSELVADPPPDRAAGGRAARRRRRHRGGAGSTRTSSATASRGGCSATRAASARAG